MWKFGAFGWCFFFDTDFHVGLLHGFVFFSHRKLVQLIRATKGGSS